MNSIPETTFGKSLRLEREARQLTQTQLAVLAGTSQQNIAGMEAGRSLPKEAIFEKLVEVFGKHSSVAQLPPRGVIKLGYDTVERVSHASKVKPVKAAATLSAQAQELGELFDMLPPDRITRTKAYYSCTQTLLEALQERVPTPSETHDPVVTKEIPHA